MRLFNSKKSILLLFVVLAASHWVVNYIFDVKENQSPLGFCEEKNRVLTYEEIILAALESKYNHNAIKTDDSTKAAQDFYKKYPFCCSFRPPSALYPRRNPLTGKLFIKDPGYVIVTLYYPTSDKVMGQGYRNNDGEKVVRDKSLNYTNSDTPVSNCGEVGRTVDIDSNIKDTPFANDTLKSESMRFYEWQKSGRDWRIISRAQAWESEEHFRAGDKNWEYSEHAKF